MKAVILAGGSGTRLWPLSREKKPKQFQALISENTLLQETVKRLDFLPKENIFVATNEAYAAEIKKQIPWISGKQFVLEPVCRDTAPCIGLAAALLAKENPDEVMAVIYADHFIQNTEEFEKKLLLATKIVSENPVLAIIEVKANYPNPHLGYVKIGKLLKEFEDGSEVYELDRFVEKPDYETAKKYMRSYKYMWNTGLYVWKISTILEKYRKYAPEVHEILMKIANGEDAGKLYEKCPKISIDYAIMEKVNPKEVWIIPADLGWSDIGNFAALFDEFMKNEKENLVQAEHVGLGTKGSIIYGRNGKLIATVGVENLVVVDTDDVLLICPKNRSADVKKLVEELKKRGKKHLI